MYVIGKKCGKYIGNYRILILFFIDFYDDEEFGIINYEIYVYVEYDFYFFRRKG